MITDFAVIEFRCNYGSSLVVIVYLFGFGVCWFVLLVFLCSLFDCVGVGFIFWIGCVGFAT